jgi:NADPH:quinone reductase-like Zn-dependent oxidoreductase
MLVTRARVLPGEWVLIWGIGGGVATAALQIARAHGARVIATSSSDEKLARARDLGATAAIRHDRDDVVAAVHEITAGMGADVVVETVGKATWDASIGAVAKGGRITICGATTGGSPPARLHQIFYRQIQVLGSTLGGDGEFRSVLRLLDSGLARPVVDSVLPFSAIAEAHRRVEQGEQMGKVVLQVGS